MGWSASRSVEQSGLVDAVATMLSDDVGLCLGYRPHCDAPVNAGAYYSILCHDEIPFVDRGALAASAEGDPGRSQAYGASPYLDLCDSWTMGDPESAVQEPVISDAPVLIMTGQFDVFSPQPVAEDAAKALQNALVLQIPGAGHNVLGSSDCALMIRNEWVDEPRETPDTSCLAEIPAPLFRTRV